MSQSGVLRVWRLGEQSDVFGTMITDNPVQDSLVACRSHGSFTAHGDLGQGQDHGQGRRHRDQSKQHQMKPDSKFNSSGLRWLRGRCDVIHCRAPTLHTPARSVFTLPSHYQVYCAWRDSFAVVGSSRAQVSVEER